MSFDLGSTYERQSDRVIAIVAKIDEKNAFLWRSTGEEEWITPADVPSLWRRYEPCPACNSLKGTSNNDDFCVGLIAGASQR
jgi:hypothetical protein